MSFTYTPQLILTGSTGSLGAYILHALLTNQSYSRIYCLARGSSHFDAHTRVLQSLNTRKLDDNLIEPFSDKVVCFAVDFSKDKLGLEQHEYDELRQGVEVIIHCAWPVNCEFIIRLLVLYSMVFLISSRFSQSLHGKFHPAYPGSSQPHEVSLTCDVLVHLHVSLGWD